MAILFNLASIWIPKPNMVAFYIIPSVLSLLQLFTLAPIGHTAENMTTATSTAHVHSPKIIF